MENDFLHMDTDNITSYGWRPQVYNVSVPADNHRIAYGKDFTMENIVPNPLKSSKKWDGLLCLFTTFACIPANQIRVSLDEE